MLLEKISETELEFLECWFNPICLAESLFSNFDRLSEFREDKFGEVRVYQFPMMSYEAIIDEQMPGLNKKEQFELRKGAGDCFSIGARKYGKTLITEKIDVPLSMLYDDGWWVGFSAPDGIHLKDVLDVIKTAIQHHPILSMWILRVARAPKYEFEAKNFWKLDGINMNVKSKEPGSKFFGKHVHKLWIEECSLETETVATNRRDSLSELGGVLRFSGMTNFTKHSPAGKTFNDPKNKNKIVNYPQFVNPHWSESDKQERLEEFGGEDTPNYRIFVKGEVIEDGISAFDMERIKDCYQTKKQIKKYEIKKDKFKYFKNLIVVERPKNAERIFVCFEEGTEILTEQGWKNFKDVKENEKVLTLNPKTNESNYQSIKHKIEQDYNGNLIEYEAENLKFSVTPNHKMLVKKKWESNFRFIEAKNLVESYVKRDLGKYSPRIDLKLACEFLDIDFKRIVIEEKKGQRHKFSLLDWLEFLGWYLSEGCTVRNQNYKICISQKNKKNREEIRNLLDRMRLPYQEQPDAFWLNSKSLFIYLRKHCYDINSVVKGKMKKTRYNCYNKKVPDFVRYLDPSLIQILLTSFIKGDGWNCKDGRCGISTTSIKLANDLHELILKTGKVATICEREAYDNHRKSYTIYIWKKNTLSKIRPQKLELKKYKGKIYCVEVEPHNTIYVKYKGKSFWCGNCADIGESAGTEIIILSEIGDNYNYLYNIALYNLKREEQEEIFKWIIEKVEANVIALDCGDAMGRNLADDFEKAYSKNNVVRYAGTSKVKVGFEKDEKGKVRIDNKGQPIFREEFMSEWSVDRLKTLLYGTRINLPVDYKFDKQFSEVISSKSGTRTLYDCISASGNHLFDAFKTFGIAQWLKKDFNQTKPVRQEHGLGTDF